EAEDHRAFGPQRPRAGERLRPGRRRHEDEQGENEPNDHRSVLAKTARPGHPQAPAEARARLRCSRTRTRASRTRLAGSSVAARKPDTVERLRTLRRVWWITCCSMSRAS